MLDKALFLLLPHKVPEVVLVIGLVISGLKGVEEVVVKIPRAGALQAGGKLLLSALFIVGPHPGAQLGGQGVALPGIAVHQGSLGRPLGSAVVVDIGGVEVGLPGGHELVHHLLDLLKVNVPLFVLGQPHQAKTQLGGVCSKIRFHNILLIVMHWFIWMIYRRVRRMRQSSRGPVWACSSVVRGRRAVLPGHPSSLLTPAS